MLDENIDNLETEKPAPEIDAPAEATEAIVPEKDKAIVAKKEVEVPKEEVEEITKKTVPEIDASADTPDAAILKKDKAIAKDKEKVVEVRPEVAEEEAVDYTVFDLEQLLTVFKKILKEESILSIKDEVEKIKQSFNQKFKILLAEKKEIFINEGGNEIDFHYSSPVKAAFNDLAFEFKTRRERHYKQIEQEQKENLAKCLELIEALKHLIDHAESSVMYNQFQELQKKWQAIGRIPRAQYNDTWRTYHHHVERFYDLLHLNKDFRDLDFKHNLEEKLKLAEKAEALAQDNDLNRAFKELQLLHKIWKEEVGPVARDFREEVWDRFSNATKIIHDKRHAFQRELDVKYEENIVKKRVVIEKIANIVSTNITSHSAWQQKIKEINTYRDEFFKLGRVPKKMSDKIWNEFKDATQIFNKNKNHFYKNVKKEQHTNLERKKALVAKAESLKDSEDFESTTNVMKQIQNEWKEIGHVPRKFSDKIWKQFKDACNHYFDRLHGNQDEINQEQLAVFDKKKELLEGIKSQADSETTVTLDLINSYIEDWNKLGKLQGNMRHVDSKFNKVINALYAKLDLDETEIEMLKFKNTIVGHLEAKDYRKLDGEQLFIRKKVNELSKEIQQLENNISFISNASDDNPLLKNVRDNIASNTNKLAIWKTKLSYLTSLDY